MQLDSGRFAACLLASLWVGSALAGPQVADSAQTIDTVEVTAQREK